MVGIYKRLKVYGEALECLPEDGCYHIGMSVVSVLSGAAIGNKVHTQYTCILMRIFFSYFEFETSYAIYHDSYMLTFETGVWSLLSYLL